MDLASSGFDLTRLQLRPSSFCASFIDIDWLNGINKHLQLLGVAI